MLPEWLSWTITGLLVVGGLAGMVLPVVPGLLLMYVGLALNKFAFFTAHPISWGAFITITVIFVIAQGAEWLAGFLGAKVAGLTWGGFWLGLAGLIVGIFFGLPGIIIGPVLGIFLGEWLVSRRQWKLSLKTSAAHVVGLLVGVVLKVAGAVAMLGVFAWAVWGT